MVFGKMHFRDTQMIEISTNQPIRKESFPRRYKSYVSFRCRKTVVRGQFEKWTSKKTNFRKIDTAAIIIVTLNRTRVADYGLRDKTRFERDGSADESPRRDRTRQIRKREPRNNRAEDRSGFGSDDRGPRDDTAVYGTRYLGYTCLPYLPRFTPPTTSGKRTWHVFRNVRAPGLPARARAFIKRRIASGSGSVRDGGGGVG